MVGCVYLFLRVQSGWIVELFRVFFCSFIMIGLNSQCLQNYVSWINNSSKRNFMSGCLLSPTFSEPCFKKEQIFFSHSNHIDIN